MFESAVLCLALGIYHEARSEPLAGQLAVSFVVMNRVDDSRYPNSICGVVTQGRTYKWNPKVMIKHQCQFTFFCDGFSDKPRDGHAWDNAQYLASNVLSGVYPNFMEGATHYHATYVQPDWAETKTKVGQVGHHIFYRWEK
jgi:N-acetylmuramoyl-L-alanine amidase